MSGKGNPNTVANVLRSVSNYHTGTGGTFWCPKGSIPDLGFTLPSRVNPSLSKVVAEQRDPKHKDDCRVRQWN
jgi:hypothetical protein